MTYGLTESKKKGIKAETDIIPELISRMEDKWNCQVSIERSNRYENMQDKIDYFISIKTPARNISMTADYKNGGTFTLFDTNGNDLIAISKADWIIKGDTIQFLFVKTSVLRNVIASHPPSLLPSKINNSKYFWLDTYLMKNVDMFDDKSLFSIPRV